MRRLIYSTMVSLDGYVEDASHALDWAIVDEELHTFINDQERKHGAHLYGRGVYETMAAYWPTADQDTSQPGYILDYARIWQNLPKIVVSTTLEKVEGNARLVRGNLVEEVTRLKEQPGGDIIAGGAGLAASLMKLDLIDEFQLFIHPVLVGGGTPMFSNSERPKNLRLIDQHTFTSGVVFLHYRKEG